ncbi:MAG: hypothetical protein PHY47_06790 [Lachnospiraceae bacterium]|nr:hypothetical protein [Lachnospiraceae bacterium]
MIENIKKNKVLFELLVGIAFWGAMVQIIGLFLKGNKPFFSIGLWSGIVVAVFMAIHMYVSISSALECQEKDAVVKVRSRSVIRYVVVVIVLFFLYVSKLGNPLSYVAGVMGLKVAAYMQPIIHRLIKK